MKKDFAIRTLKAPLRAHAPGPNALIVRIAPQEEQGTGKKPPRGFTTASEERSERLRSLRPSAAGAKPRRGFTLLELLVTISIIGLMASAILAALTNAQLEARDKRRVSDIKQLENALNLYYTRYNTFPTEASGANGNVGTNQTFKDAIAPFMPTTPNDPNGVGNATYYYYYDGKHNCGGRDYAIIFARQMDKAVNSNYDQFLNTTCSGVVDGEGRGGGTQSYNLLIGTSGD